MRRGVWKMVRFCGGNMLWAGLFMLIMGCATNPIAHDLVNYVNQGLLRIEELEKRPLEEYAAVTGTYYKNDQEVYETLKNKVIPLYERFLNELREINPAEVDVRRLHGQYIRGADKMLTGFKTKMRGIERKDERMILEANDMILGGRAEIEQWREELLSLCAEHRVSPERKATK